MTLPPCPPVEPRRPLDDDDPDGYLESDRDYLDNNAEACLWFLENHELILNLLQANGARV